LFDRLGFWEMFRCDHAYHTHAVRQREDRTLTKKCFSGIPWYWILWIIVFAWYFQEYHGT